MTTAISQAQRTIVAIEALKRCPVCRHESCDCWTDLAQIVARQAENAHKLAAFDDVLETAMAYARAVTEHCDHQYEVAPELAALLAAIKKARPI